MLAHTSDCSFLYSCVYLSNPEVHTYFFLAPSSRLMFPSIVLKAVLPFSNGSPAVLSILHPHLFKNVAFFSSPCPFSVDSVVPSPYKHLLVRVILVGI